MAKKVIHIFKSGTHTDMHGKTIEFSDADVKAVADNYSADNQAPIVVGHPKTDDPAFGWVKGLSFSDGGLYAELDQVNPDFAEMVKDGAFKKVSASFYSPSSPNNPNKGSYSLKHVGFLGACAPAVKGLDPIQFSEHADDVVIEFAGFEAPRSLVDIVRNLREWLISEKGLEDANAVFPTWMVDSIGRAVDEQYGEKNTQFSEALKNDVPKKFNANDNDGTKKEVNMTEEELKKAQDAFEVKEKALADKEAKMQANSDFAEAKATIDGFVTEGKILPAEADGVAQFMAGLNGDNNSVSFADGDNTVSKSPKAFMEGFLKTLPKRTPDTGALDVGGASFTENEAEAVTLAAQKIVDDSNGSISFSDAVVKVKVNKQ